MQVKVLKNEGLSYELEITIPANDIDERVDTKLQEVGKTIKMPGFRPGKVPMKLVKQRYGKAVLGEVLEGAVNDTSVKAMEDNKIKPAIQPKIEVKEFDEGKDLVYTISLEALPEVKVSDLKKIKLEKPICKVEEKEVNEALENIAKVQKDSTPIKGKRASKEGDIVVIDFKGKRADGHEVPGMSAEGTDLELGSGTFIPGFEEQLIGKKAGEELEVKVTFPENYGHEELAGQDAVFEVKINEIREVKPAEINDDFAKKSGFENLDKMKEAVKAQIASEYEKLSRMKVKRSLLDILDKEHKFDLPQAMVDMEFDAIVKQVEHDHSHHEHGEGEECNHEITDEDKEELKAIAERRVRLGLVLAEIGNENKITVSDQELQRAVITEAQRYPGQEKQIFDFYSKNKQALESLRAPLFEDKVVDYILELADVKEKEVSLEELQKEDEEEEVKASTSKKKSTKKKDSKDKKTTKTTKTTKKAAAKK